MCGEGGGEGGGDRDGVGYESCIGCGGGRG